MSPAEALLVELRTQNVRVRLDGDGIRCKAPDGVIPSDLAQRIRDLKPELLALLMETEARIAQQGVAQLGDALLGDAPDAGPGVCAHCGAAMPPQPGRKCTRCCLASAALLDRRRIEEATYPMNV